MKKSIQWGSLIFLIAAACMLLLEGGFRISTGRYDQLQEMVTLENALLLESGESSRADVVVFLYEETGKDNVYYLVEFSKNSLWNRYCVAEVNRWEDTGAQTYNSVASSAMYHYPYSVDLQRKTVTIFEGTRRNNLLYSVCIFGAVCLVQFLVRKRRA